MRTREQNYAEDIEFLNEECLNLAKDIIDLDEDFDGLVEWGDGFVEHYNNALDTIDQNFDTLEEKIEEVIDKHNALGDEVTDLNFHKTLLWGFLIVNFILTLLLVFNVL